MRLLLCLVALGSLCCVVRPAGQGQTGRPEDGELYTCLVDERSDGDAFVQVYWARASHMGEAIHMVLDAARANGLRNPVACECDFYDIDYLEAEVSPGADADVFWSAAVHYVPSEPAFELPTGVIHTCDEDEHDVNDIVRGFAMEVDEEGLTSIDVNVEADRLLPLYGRLVGMRPAYKVFWYVLHDHWGDDPEDRYLTNDKLNAPDQILEHLRGHALDSIQNGFVTLTAYLEEGETNLNISDHKRIWIYTYSGDLAKGYAESLEAAGYPELESAISIDHRMHHWHYRPHGSRTKLELESMLKESGFTDWKPKDEE